MADVKHMLIMLMALHGSYVYSSCGSHNNIRRYPKLYPYPYNSTTYLLSNGTLEIKFDNDQIRITIKCRTDDNEPVMLPLNITYIKMDPRQKYRSVTIENCVIAEGFGALFNHLGIKEEVLQFEAKNASHQSFKVRFPSGFEKVVEELSLSNNQIKQLNADMFQSLPQLLTLDLSVNGIEELPERMFRNLLKLRTLNLNGNRLTSLHAGMFSQTNLTVLTFHHNRLDNLTKEMFEGLDSLTFLDVSSNNLTNLRDGLFKFLKELTCLYIRNNRLTSISG